VKKSDTLFWVGLGAVLLYLWNKRNPPGTVPYMPWTFTGLGFDPNYIAIPPAGARNVAIANKTQQPSFQGGTRSPTVISTQVDESAAGNVYSGVPFMY
jgi:hypothetical protein